MLRNMKVGTKLLAVVLPPLLVLVAVAGFGAKDRLDEAADARVAEQYVELGLTSSGAMAALQAERSLSVLAAANDGAAETLDAARAATDQAILEVRAVADDLSSSSPVRAAADEFTGRMNDIATIRGSVDRGGIDPLIVNSWYTDSIAKHLDMLVVVSNEMPLPEVTADLSALVALSRATEASAQLESALTVGLANDQFDAEGRQWRALLSAMNQASQYQELYFVIASPQQSAALRRLLQQADASSATEFREGVVSAMAATLDWLVSGADHDGTPNSITREVNRVGDVSMLSPIEWIEASGSILDAQREVGTDILTSVSDLVGETRSATERQALLFLLVAAAAVIISAVLALVVARRITKPLRELTTAADRLSSEQLPALVERLKSPGSGGGEVILEPINMDRSDEIGHLADAFDAIQRVTVDVAEEQQALLKKGIGDIFVNLARRNQTLLDRQIEFIDQLESQEEDPDVLEDLFKLDHLATRMRRNAESLLVLAGIETGHRRSRPVALADVVRVAIGEVEDFARLNLVAIDDAVVTGTAAMDVAHLLSELMENATSFSPPETTVEILGHQNADGTYVLSISDQGIGMSDEQFTEINALLAEPPLVGLTLSRSLGFTVVGRLAARFKIDVRLTSSPTGGVTALVNLPTTVLEAPSISVEEVPEVAAEEIPAPLPEPVEPAAPLLAPDRVDDAPAPATLATAVPEGAAFDAGLAALMGEDGTDETPVEPAPEVPAPVAVDAVAEAAPEASPEPVRTSAGLVRRVPRANAGTAEVDSRPANEPPIARNQRSPEEVRAMLSRYRSGLHRGREVESPNGDGTN